MEIRIVEKQLRYNKNQQIRKRWRIVKEGFLSGDIKHFCEKEGIKRSYYYFWFNRLKESGWKIEALQDRSRRPKSSLTDKLEQNSRYHPFVPAE